MVKLNEHDWRRVQAMVNYLWDWREYTEGIGDGAIAVAIGLPWTTELKDRSRAKIRQLMPHVVEGMYRLHPGWVPIRPGGKRSGLVVVTNDPDEVFRATRGRRASVLTKMRRVNAELETVRRYSTDPAEQRLAARWEIATDALEKAVTEPTTVNTTTKEESNA